MLPELSITTASSLTGEGNDALKAALTLTNVINQETFDEFSRHDVFACSDSSQGRLPV